MRGVSLAPATGNFTSIRESSGAGKSTLLQCAAVLVAQRQAAAKTAMARSNNRSAKSGRAARWLVRTV